MTTCGSGWHELSRLNTGPKRSNRMAIVSISQTEAYMVGGWTDRHGYSTRNWYLWNPRQNKFAEV